MDYNPLSPYSDDPKYYNRYKCLRGNLIILEGIISAGKTTLGKSLLKFLTKNGIKCIFFVEQVNKELLDLYIKNMGKYAFSFQVIVARERVNILKNAIELCKDGNICIIDRGLLGDISFARMQYDKNNLNDEEWNVYNKLVKYEKFSEPDCTLFLDCNIDTAFERLLDRNNKNEVEGYTKEYFEDLNNSYNKTLEEFNLKNLVKIDWNDRKNIVDGYLTEEYCMQILDIIKKKIIN